MNPGEDDCISITLGDSIYTSDASDSFAIADDTFSFSTTDNGNWMWEDLLDKPSIKIGKHEITEETAEKLQALLDVIDSLEDDNDFKALFNTQLAFNRINNIDENKSD